MSECRILVGDCRAGMATLSNQSVQTCVTSPPYFGLRDYGNDGQIGLESTPDAYVAELVAVFREVRRVLKDDGTLWLNLGDTYSATRWSKGNGQPMNNHADEHRSMQHEKNSGLPDKNLLGLPWKTALALQGDGWFLRQDIIWHKPATMPDSARDRFTRNHEYLFLLSKQARYFFDHEAVREPANDSPDGKRTKRTVWTISVKPYAGAHFATFPPDLIEPCILAGSKKGDLVLDPFGGSGTTGAVATGHGRDAVLCELNPEYADLAVQRIGPMFTTTEVIA